MSNALIRRLKERIRSEPTVDFGPFCPPIRPRPPVSEQTLAEAAPTSRCGLSEARDTAAAGDG